jgi:hypothetical protein
VDSHEYHGTLEPINEETHTDSSAKEHPEKAIQRF